MEGRFLKYNATFSGHTVGSVGQMILFGGLDPARGP